MILRISGLLALAASGVLAQGAGEPVPLPGSAAQAQAAQEPELLTLPRALALAEQYNPQLRAASAQIEGATAAVVTAGAYPNPELNILSGPQYSRYNLRGAGVPGLLQHYSASQTIELPSVRDARIQAARMGREASGFALAGARVAVRASVKQAFYQVLRQQEEIEVARENLRLIEDLRRRIQVQVNVGEAARLELVRADAELATARNFARSAQLRLVTAISVLRAVISAPLGPDLDVQGALQPPTTLEALDTLRTDVLARHPALAEARAEVRRAQERLRTERALAKPQPSLHTEYERQPDLGFFRVGISLPIPLWNRREGPIGEAVAALHQATALADLRRVEITAALERAYGHYEVATQQLTAYQEGALREAEAALNAAEAAFKFGERGILEVLDAQRVLRSVRTELLNAQFDRQAALIELEQLRAVDFGQQP